MRVICDAPGQTCNRLWSYLAAISECIVKKKKLMIIFYDWTIEDFPNLLYCPWIYYPLWQPWFLRLPKGWGWYKHLTWKMTHNKFWDWVFNNLGFIKGWHTRRETKYIAAAKKEIQQLYRPKKEITDKGDALIKKLHQEADIVVGVHIRRGDYATWNNGRFLYSLEEYHGFMLRLQEYYQNKKVAFFISSNESFSLNQFKGCICQRFDKESSGAILDLYTLSICDYIIGPFSTYSRWASFFGEVPLCFLEEKNQQFASDSFSKIIDFFHFENGKELFDW